MSFLSDYLDYYTGLEAPGYAVLVTGAWGSGKTFQVKRAIPAEERIYVSLYGVGSVAELHAEVLAAAFPSLGQIEKAFGQATGAAQELGAPAALRAVPAVMGAVSRRALKPDRTLVFDDLERSSLPTPDLLGAINQYLEHRGFRVVVIAHDEKILGDFGKVQEKLFGQTFRVAPMTEEAFETFVMRLPTSEDREFVDRHRDAILGIFSDSEASSLRILRHVIEDLGRLRRSLAEHHLANAEAMTHLVRLFSALSIEVRAGRLTEKHLRSRDNTYLFRAASELEEDGDSGGGKTLATTVAAADDRYPGLSLTDGLLPDSLAVAMIVHGQFDAGSLGAALDNSSYFLAPADAPPWKVVSNFDDLEDDIVDQARHDLARQFEDRTATEIGEMLHMFALRLMMVSEGVQPGNLDQEVLAQKAYIDDLVAQKKLSIPVTGVSRHTIERAYGGYAYWVIAKTSDAFVEVRQYLIEKSKVVRKEAYPEVAEHLLGDMSTDARLFADKVGLRSGDGSYASVPVLTGVTPERFVTTWLGLHSKDRGIVASALEERWDGRLGGSLSEEKGWAEEVLNLLEKRSEPDGTIEALRIRRMIGPIQKRVRPEPD